jgi:hypothetical protein
MQSLHEQLASDEYWQQPAVPEAEQLSARIEAQDRRSANAVLRGIESAFAQIAENGPNIQRIQPGDMLHISEADQADGILKVIQDKRISGETPNQQPASKAGAHFDEHAEEMEDVFLYDGPAASIFLESPRGVVGIGREVFYFRYSSSGKQLIGLASAHVGFSRKEPQYEHPVPVGHVNTLVTPTLRMQSRFVVAQVLTPRPNGYEQGRRAKHAWPGFRLLPRILPDGI